MATFPELQGEAQTGKTKMWKIAVLDRNGQGVIQTTFGYTDGKKQTNEKIIAEGKNIGKKNETTPLQQAINEARTAWVKKKESGYHPQGVGESEGQAKQEQVQAQAKQPRGQEKDDDDDVIMSAAATEGSRSKGVDASVPSPMLAHDYNKRGKSIQFPCYVQRKYDGTRCVGIPNKGLFSRNRKAYPHLEHIFKELNQLSPHIILDGELYSDTLTFQEIVGLVKRETLKPGDEEKQKQIQFHVYDIINDQPYELRMQTLSQLFTKSKFHHLVPVQTDVCQSEEHMKELHAKYVAEGYEGIMLRNKNGHYKCARSDSLQKYKEFFDNEYEVVDFREGEGLEAGCVLWVCQTPEGKVFHCRPRGTREDRIQLFQEGKKYVGKHLTVRFQELTTDGIPRFPVGIAFRDYE
jgi:ATP-dependent DNA ligase